MVKRLILGLLTALALCSAAVPQSIDLPSRTVYGRLGAGTGPGEAIPFANFSGGMLSAISGDCTVSSAGVITCTKTNGITFATTPFVTIGDVTGFTGERALNVGQGLVGTDAGANSTYTIRRNSENTVTNGLDWPVSNDAAIRIAAGVDGLSYGVVYYGGNGLWLYDTFSSTYRMGRITGAFLTVDLTNCTIDGVANQARVAGTHYYIYAYFATAGAANAAYELSTTAPTTGDPLGATTVTGWHFKNDGTRNKRLVGTAMSDAAGVFWRAGARGVYMSGISSYYQRQKLNYHMHVGGGNTTSTTWVELNSNHYLSAMMWDDGAEPFIQLSGSVSNSTNATVVSIGVSIDAETPPYDYVDVYTAVLNQPYPFSVTVTGGDFSTTLHTYRVFMKVSSGTGTLNAGANFAMKLEQ